MGKWFLTDNSATFGRILMIFFRQTPLNNGAGGDPAVRAGLEHHHDVIDLPGGLAARPTARAISAAPLLPISPPPTQPHRPVSSARTTSFCLAMLRPRVFLPSPLPRLPPGSHAATAAPGRALLELARAARPGRGSMSCLRSVPVNDRQATSFFEL